MSFNNTQWDNYATCYDVLNQLKPYQEMYAEIVKGVAHAKPHKILDASCGTGNLLTYCNQLSQIENMHFTCIDFSQAMLEIAQSKPTDARTSFAHINLNKPLPYRDESFDMVVSINTLYAVKNPERTLKEFYRVLIKGGVLIFTTMKPDFHAGMILGAHAQSTKSDSYWRFDLSNERLVANRIAEACDCKDLEAQIVELEKYNAGIDQSFARFITYPEWRSLLQKIGFDIQVLKDCYANQNDLFVLRRRLKS